MITDDTLGFDAHHAIPSWAIETPSSEAIGLSPFTFLSVSSTSDLLARFWKEKHNTHVRIIPEIRIG